MNSWKRERQREMERMTKAMLILTALLVAMSVEAEGARMVKSNNNDGQQQVDQPQNFFGGIGGGSIPGPGFTGIGFGPSGFFTFPGSGGSVSGLPTISSPPAHGAEKP